MRSRTTNSVAGSKDEKDDADSSALESSWEKDPAIGARDKMVLVGLVGRLYSVLASKDQPGTGWGKEREQSRVHGCETAEGEEFVTHLSL